MWLTNCVVANMQILWSNYSGKEQLISVLVPVCTPPPPTFCKILVLVCYQVPFLIAYNKFNEPECTLSLCLHPSHNMVASVDPPRQPYYAKDVSKEKGYIQVH